MKEITKNKPDAARLKGMLPILLGIVLALLAGTATAQVRRNEISAGVGLSVYQSVYSMQLNQQFEVSYGRLLSENWKAAAGFRYYLDPKFPAGYVRLVLFNRFGAWKPSLGLEAGFSKPVFKASDRLLQETREAMTRDLGTVYFSGHIAPLCFSLKNWNFSAIELNTGSHLKHPGRTVFLQINFLHLAYSF